MIKINEIIVVEGKYDQIKLSSFLDAVIITTDGFGIFKNKEKRNLLQKLAQKQGVLILTDSDSAGFVIRNHLKSVLPGCTVRHAYIPDLAGKEKRKQKPGKEGKLGVEGMKEEQILKALTRAGITRGAPDGKKITKQDFYEDGFSGRPDSALKRKQLQKTLDFPQQMTTNALLDALNLLFTYEEYKEQVEKL